MRRHLLGATKLTQPRISRMFIAKGITQKSSSSGAQCSTQAATNCRSYGARGVEFVGYKYFVRAPSKARCFLLGESPSRVKTNQQLVPSVAAVRRSSQDRTKRLKRTQGITQAARETALS